MRISTLQDLEAIYGEAPVEASLVKESDRLTAEYRALVEASPFVVLATIGPDGLDCSPRGDRGAAVRVLDDRHVALPDRRGNNRIDSLRNIVADPRVALLFLIPGSGTTFRINGRATISADPDLRASFETEGKRPKTVVTVAIEVCYFQCARAVVRSKLWDGEARADPGSLPTPGRMLAALSEGAVGGKAYDEAWPERARRTLW